MDLGFHRPIVAQLTARHIVSSFSSHVSTAPLSIGLAAKARVALSSSARLRSGQGRGFIARIGDSVIAVR